ncbi:MAG: respiratory nitrate reductase subunit gamma [Proteobacteria bacterium]|nr:respiratory nitrate reductase subunit gamma [Pseudomonadota bacterium]
MNIFLALLTYFAYIFIIAIYTIKIVKYLRLPVHLRWDLYPVIHEEKYHYGGSYYENLEWWTLVRQKSFLKGLVHLLKEYLNLGEYLKRHKSYWLVLYPWHVGFILIILFHILCFFGAVAMLADLDISAESNNLFGQIFYYKIIIIGVASFIAGAFGSIGLIIKRLTDENLRSYTSPLNYFTYIFTLMVFLSGLYDWYFFDPTLSEYREFWKGLITFNFIDVKTTTAIHIIIFAFFLIYLPYTRSLHYITRLFAYFLIRWDDEPNLRGSILEKKLTALLNQKVTWAGPHIQSGKKWNEQ